jgi:hypothetical protein
MTGLGSTAVSSKIRSTNPNPPRFSDGRAVREDQKQCARHARPQFGSVTGTTCESSAPGTASQRRGFDSPHGLRPLLSIGELRSRDAPGRGTQYSHSACHRDRSASAALFKIRTTPPHLPAPLEARGGRSPNPSPHSYCRPRARHSAWSRGLLPTRTPRPLINARHVRPNPQTPHRRQDRR